MIHTEKGLFFEVLESGDIRITKTDDGNVPNEERSNVVFAQTLSKQLFEIIADACLERPERRVFYIDVEDGLWFHFCKDEQSPMMIGKGEPCNWCGGREECEPRLVDPAYFSQVSTTF